MSGDLDEVLGLGHLRGDGTEPEQHERGGQQPRHPHHVVEPQVAATRHQPLLVTLLAPHLQTSQYLGVGHCCGALIGVTLVWWKGQRAGHCVDTGPLLATADHPHCVPCIIH